MTEVLVTTEAIRRASQIGKKNLQKNSSQIVTTNKRTPNFLLVGCPSCHPNNSV